MFDIGWTEIIIIIIIASVMLELKDIPGIIKACKQLIKQFNGFVMEIKQLLLNIEKETNKIIDLDGNEQDTYDISDIMPKIKPEKSIDESNNEKNSRIKDEED